MTSWLCDMGPISQSMHVNRDCYRWAGVDIIMLISACGFWCSIYCNVSYTSSCFKAYEWIILQLITNHLPHVHVCFYVIIAWLMQIYHLTLLFLVPDMLSDITVFGSLMLLYATKLSLMWWSSFVIKLLVVSVVTMLSINHIPNKVWYWITYPFTSFNSAAIWGRMNDSTPYMLDMWLHVITCDMTAKRISVYQTFLWWVRLGYIAFNFVACEITFSLMQLFFTFIIQNNIDLW